MFAVVTELRYVEAMESNSSQSQAFIQFDTASYYSL